ncbi:MAG TPA: wax ester/triacylglycerol synthase family O-acyltransferase [Acidimicrobiales bacterium]|nr:wax ester/triacylglycerol synthase family O-acyltransferase [Acidimicrobiales bacterium]
MKRLSGTDALFLSAETPAWHQHVGGLIVVEPATSDRFSFDQLRHDTAERLRGVPKFRWKLKEVPLHLDREVWVEDKDFNIGRHVRRIAVPPPGGRHEVGELVGMLMTYQLDRRHPLWEMWYIDGVVGGQVAIFTKFHHCLMDGVSGMGLAEQLLDVEANPPPRQPTAVGEDDAGPYEPSDLELVARALVPTIQTPRKLLQYVLRTAQRGATLLQQRTRNPLAMGVAGPCFNGSVGPRRTIAFTSVGLEDVRTLKDALGVKVNDIVLALVSGALRAHMLRHDELPTKGSLVAGVPVSTRVADDIHPSNQLAVMMASLATDVGDPLERVQAIHRSTQSAKELSQAVRARKIQSLGEVAPPLLLGLASRAAWASNVSRRLPVVENLTVSNLPGPPFPLYVCGAQVSGIYAASVLYFNGGLNITLMSYTDRVDFGLTADPDLLDDPWEIADAIPSALVELMDAADLGKPTGVHDPFDR